MAFDIKNILNAATAGAAAETIEKDFEEIRLDYEKIIVTKHNKYSMDEIEELAAGIEMVGGLHEPLILGRVNGEYWLASGHRRRAAIEMLVQGGAENFRVVNCRYKDMTETEFRLHVLIGNTFNRHYTDYDKMMEAEEWKKALKAAQIGGRLPNVPALQAEYEKLQAQKESLYADYGKLKKQVAEYDVIKRNIDSILQAEKQTERKRETER